MYNLAWQKYNEVQWVQLLDSGREWPTLWISVCTHGWEVVWLDILQSLIEEIQITEKLTRWRIFLILSNISAYRKYRTLVESWKEIDAKDLVSTRFVDENMNRCCDVDNIKNSRSKEVVRILELTPILSELDVIFDIHSTYAPSDSMSIITRRSFQSFWNTFNVHKRLVWITEVQAWKPFIDIVERMWWVWIGLESGCQLDASGYKIWLDNSLRLLAQLWMIDINDEEIQRHIWPTIESQTLNIFWNIIVRSKDFRFSQEYKHLDVIKKWELFCYDGENEVYAERDFLIIMPSSNSTDFSKLIWEEACFMWEML